MRFPCILSQLTSLYIETNLFLAAFNEAFILPDWLQEVQQFELH